MITQAGSLQFQVLGLGSENWASGSNVSLPTVTAEPVVIEVTPGAFCFAAARARGLGIRMGSCLAAVLPTEFQHLSEPQGLHLFVGCWGLSL